MAHTLIRHEVKDFAKWKGAFDRDEGARAAAGEDSWRIFQDASNPNKVTVLTKFTSLEHAKQHLHSDNFRQTVQAAGVIGDPEIHYLQEVL